MHLEGLEAEVRHPHMRVIGLATFHIVGCSVGLLQDFSQECATCAPQRVVYVGQGGGGQTQKLTTTQKHCHVCQASELKPEVEVVIFKTGLGASCCSSNFAGSVPQWIPACSQTPEATKESSP